MAKAKSRVLSLGSSVLCLETRNSKPGTPDPLVRFILEAGQLKKLPRSGWLTINIKNPESIADHSHRTAVIGYLLAQMEKLGKAEAGDVVIACIFHDMSEARLSDLTPLNKKYLKVNSQKAADDVFSQIPGGKDVLALAKNKKLMDIVSDADKLEMIFQAKEYADGGNRYALAWIESAEKLIKTNSGKRLLGLAKTTDSFECIVDACD